jgi:hypothetical protein
MLGMLLKLQAHVLRKTRLVVSGQVLSSPVVSRVDLAQAELFSRRSHVI